MKISPISVKINHNLKCDNNQNQKVSFNGFGDYGFIVNPDPQDDCAEQKQTFMEGLKGAGYILALPVILPLAHMRDKATGRAPNYSDMDRLEAEYFDDDFDEPFEEDFGDVEDLIEFE